MELKAWGAKTARNKAICEAIAAGQTLSEIGAKHGLTRERVRQIGLRAGVKSTGGAPRLTDEEKARFRELYLRGMPVQHISETLGRAPPTAYKYLKREGIHEPTRDQTVWSAREDKFVRDHYKTPGWSAADIGEHLGRTRDEVIGRANRLGLCDPQERRKAAARKRKTIAAMARLRKRGRTYTEIGAELGSLPEP